MTPEITKTMFSSATDMWATPQDFFDRLNAKFHFETDVCATNENAKCDHWFTPEMDGLSRDWRGVCWMNPPYGRGIGAWIEKAFSSARENGATVVCLIPARTDTRWWHDYCVHGEITYIKGRLKFGDAKDSAPFPSAVVVFKPAYAAPAPQSPSKAKTPLTEEQLRNIAIGYKANDQQRMRDHWDLFVDFARDVEVAHGITGETKGGV